MEMKVGQAQKLASRDELSDEPQPVSGNKTFFKGGHWARPVTGTTIRLFGFRLDVAWPGRGSGGGLWIVASIRLESS